MKYRKILVPFFSALCLGICQCLFAQENLNIKFGKISPDDFKISVPKYDTGANAVIIANVGKTTFEGNNKGFFSIVFTRFTRVKIINKNGFNVADYSIYLTDFRNGTLERVTDLKAVTYNLENGTIQQTKLEDKSIFDEKSSKYTQVKKFTMPALKEGSIYDLTYTVKSNYFSDPPTWNFQGTYPCLWSEYEATIPSMFHYLLKKRGDDHYDMYTSKAVMQTYGIHRSGGAIETDDMINVSCTSFQNRWVKKNVPAFKAQPFVSSVTNYLSSIYFELEYFKQDEEHEKDIEIKTWSEESHRLLNLADFGLELSQSNSWMDEELQIVTAGSANNEEEIKRIFHLIRDNFLCTDHTAIYTNNALKDVYKKRAGNVAELNLLLVAMLRHQHMAADPAILSTRDNGVVSNIPLIYEYNYLICIVKVGEKIFKLDASQPFNAFGNLTSDCYNWSGRIINEDRPDSINLSPDSVTETKMTNVVIINDEKGRLNGNIRTTYGNDDSYDIREEIKKTSSKEYFKKVQTGYLDITVSNEQIDSLNKPDFPLAVQYDIDFKDLKDDDIFYFSPILNGNFKTNPFAAAERLYPVEIPYKMDYTFLLTMEIPKGFRVDELPKSARVKLNENEGMFEYLTQQNTDNIQMRVHLKLNKATFSTDDYATLRDFFAFVVKKESEQIVFKKSP